MLILRPNHFQGDPPDFTVVWREGEGQPGFEIGRIFCPPGVPRRTPWVWSVAFHQRRGRTRPHQGVAATRDAAIEAFQLCWESSPEPPNNHAKLAVG
jgi:hypothetical protein